MSIWDDISKKKPVSRLSEEIRSIPLESVLAETRKAVGGRNSGHMTSTRGAVKSGRVGTSFSKVGAGATYQGLGAGSDTRTSGFMTFYNPIFSLDFFEIPYELQERRQWYRHFYQYDEYVGRAIDLLTNLPLSKVTLQSPAGRNPDRNKYVMAFFQRMVDRIKLFEANLEVAHEWWLFGNCFVFAQDSDGHEEDADPYRSLPEFKDLEAKGKWYDEKFGKRSPGYIGWDRLLILPIDQLKIRSFEFSDATQVEYVPTDSTRALLVQYGLTGGFDLEFGHLQPAYNQIPEELVDAVKRGDSLYLNTDPYKGSAVIHLARKKSSYDDWGVPILDRCLKNLIYRDKLRQIQTLIVNRKMTPVRVVWGDKIDDPTTDELREMVDLALMEPDFSIVANYEINWQEIGAQERILNLTAEYEEQNRRLQIGMGIPNSILTGESSYGGTRIGVEIMNTEFSLFREIIAKTFIEEFIFKPVAYKKGFIEIDEFGNEVLLYPKLRFTRLSLRDTDTMYDQLFNGWSKGLFPADALYDLYNIDSEDAKTKIQQDLFTTKDPLFNELVRGLYGEVARKLAEDTDVVDKLIQAMGLKREKKKVEEKPAEAAPAPTP